MFEHDARSYIQLTNLLNHLLEMRADFNMNRNPIATCLSKGFNISSWFFNHQVDIKRQGCQSLQSLNDQRTNGDVGNEMSIHHINMNHISSCLFDSLPLLTKAAEIS